MTVSPPADAPAEPTFAELVGPALPWLYGLARRLVGADHAEDLVQECLLRAYRARRDLRDTAAVAAWLRRILVNLSHDRARRDDRRVAEVPVEDVEGWSLYRTLIAEDPLPYSDSLHLDFLESFGVEDVWAVLDRLPAIYRIPLVLVHMEGYSAREVADIQDTPLGTVLSRLARGRKHFERELWHYAEETHLLTTPAGAPS